METPSEKKPKLYKYEELNRRNLGKLNFTKKEIDDLLELRQFEIEFIIKFYNKLQKDLHNSEIVAIAINKNAGKTALENFFVTPYKGNDNMYKYLEKYHIDLKQRLQSKLRNGITSQINNLFKVPHEISGTKYDNLYDFLLSKPELKENKKLLDILLSVLKNKINEVFIPDSSGKSMYDVYHGRGWPLSTILNSHMEELDRKKPKAKQKAAAAAAAAENSDDLEEAEEEYQEIESEEAEEEYQEVESEESEEVMPTKKKRKFPEVTAAAAEEDTDEEMPEHKSTLPRHYAATAETLKPAEHFGLFHHTPKSKGPTVREEERLQLFNILDEIQKFRKSSSLRNYKNIPHLKFSYIEQFLQDIKSKISQYEYNSATANDLEEGLDILLKELDELNELIQSRDPDDFKARDSDDYKSVVTYIKEFKDFKDDLSTKSKSTRPS